MIPVIIQFFSILINLFRIFLNHLVNIPLNLLAGVGKLYAAFIAFFIDVVQLTIYTKILEGVRFSEKIKPILLKIFPSEQEIETRNIGYKKFISSKKLTYLGAFILASMPIYTGGICAAAVLAHTAKLNKIKSYIVILAGSMFGCFFLVYGINYLLELIKILISKI